MDWRPAARPRRAALWTHSAAKSRRDRNRAIPLMNPDVVTDRIGRAGGRLLAVRAVLAVAHRRQAGRSSACSSRRSGAGRSSSTSCCSTRAPGGRWTTSRRCSGPASRWSSSISRCPARDVARRRGAVRRGDARVEAHLQIRRALAAGSRRPHRPGDGRDARARGRPAGAPAAGARDRRIGRPLHRPLRHGVGHHDVVPGDRRVEQHQPRRSSRRASRRRCLRPRSGFSPPSRRSSSTTSSPRRCRGSRRAWKASPTSSPRSCRARSTSGTPPDGRHTGIRRPERTPAQGASPPSADGGDQRHAVRRRDARASHHLHGGGAASDRRRADRPAARRRRSSWRARPSRSPSRSAPTARSSCRTRRSTPTSWSPRSRRSARTASTSASIVRGDQNADYGTIMRVLGRLNAAGYKHIGLVTLEETDS